MVGEQLSELAVFWLLETLKQEGWKGVDAFAPNSANHLADLGSPTLMQRDCRRATTGPQSLTSL